MDNEYDLKNDYSPGSRANPSIPKPKPPRTPLYSPREKDKFSADKYNIKNYSYPEDIMSNNYGKNYAIFYINVAVDSKLFNDKTVETVEDYAPRDRGQLIALNTNLYSNPTSAGAKAGFVGLNATGAAVQGGLVGGLVAGKKGAALGAAANAAPDALMIGAAATQAASVTRAQKRLKTAIALHIPNQLAVRYSTNWGDEDTFGYQAAAAGAEAITKAIQGGGIKNLGNDAASIVGAIGLKSDKQGAAASAAMGLAGNPKKEQVFKGVDFRTFQFDYQFFPRSPEEAVNVMNIIQEFKYHMHPEFKDTNNFLYIYPSEFDIFYYQNGEENLNIHRHTSCVLKELNINYTPNGMFTTFDNGMPTQINVQMTFVELSVMDKDKIKNGL
jgi:hypothetical protein